MLRILNLYKQYQSIVNTVVIVTLLMTVATCALRNQYKKGEKAGKVAARVEDVNQTTKEVRKNITEAVVIVQKNFDSRIKDIQEKQDANVIPEITDPVLKDKYENPELGISDEMFDSINKARAETEQ